MATHIVLVTERKIGIYSINIVKIKPDNLIVLAPLFTEVINKLRVVYDDLFHTYAAIALTLCENTNPQIVDFPH